MLISSSLPPNGESASCAPARGAMGSEALWRGRSPGSNRRQLRNQFFEHGQNVADLSTNRMRQTLAGLRFQSTWSAFMNWAQTLMRSTNSESGAEAKLSW
jgi:hypothetical protein